MSDFPRSYVTVERMPFGTTQFSDCALDVFDPETLTVTRNDTEATVQEFQPGTWRTATVFDRRGHPISHFISQAEQDQRRQAADLANERLARQRLVGTKG